MANKSRAAHVFMPSRSISLLNAPRQRIPFLPEGDNDDSAERWILGAYARGKGDSAFFQGSSAGVDFFSNALGAHRVLSSPFSLCSVSERQSFARACTPSEKSNPLLAADLLAASFCALRGHRMIVGEDEVELGAADDEYGSDFLRYCDENSVCAWAECHAEALRAVQAGRFGDAASSWEEALLEHTGDLFALLFLNETYWKLGETQRMWATAVRVKPWWEARHSDHILGHFYGMLSRGFAADARYRDAETFAARALDLCPDDTQATASLAEVYVRENRYREADRLVREMQEFGNDDSVCQSFLRLVQATKSVECGNFGTASTTFSDVLAAEDACAKFDVSHASAFIWRYRICILASLPRESVEELYNDSAPQDHPSLLAERVLERIEVKSAEPSAVHIAMLASLAGQWEIANAV